ncbi:MAG: class I SAM-dependent methyltransferase [Methylocystis sp.]
MKTRIVRRLGLENRCFPHDPFAHQANSSTRAFEYPWVAKQLPSQPSSLLEIGGGLSGLQFVLGRIGHQVINVDPGQSELRSGWKYSDGRFERLVRSMGTSVVLQPTKIDAAQLSSEQFDAAYCISVLEHLPAGDVDIIFREVWRVLKPGGKFILTVDLFLNLIPFSHRSKNEYGVNLNIAECVAIAPFKMISGSPSELYGFERFDPQQVLGRLEEYLIDPDYPVLTQALVLMKEGPTS